MDEVRIVVYGRPAPQGSKKLVTNAGYPRMLESSAALVPWRDAVLVAARTRMRELGGGVCQRPPLNGPLQARMVFTLGKPASAPKRRRTWPCRAPDASKLLRGTEDALTDAGVWVDDARVVDYTRVAKVYPDEDPEALDVPGALIVVRTLPATAVPVERHTETLQLAGSWL